MWLKVTTILHKQNGAIRSHNFMLYLLYKLQLNYTINSNYSFCVNNVT